MPSKYSKALRYKVLPGYPIEVRFKTIMEVKEYLSGDKITCLLCGKEYKKIGVHVTAIHDMSTDEYREKYNIPWRYGLVSSETFKRYSKATRKRIEGGWMPPTKTQEELNKYKKRPCPLQQDLSKKNLGVHGQPKHPLTLSPSGQLETFSQRRRRYGNELTKEKRRSNMQGRPQCQPKEVAKRFKEYWTGRKQSPEHIEKRFKVMRENKRKRGG